MARCRMCGRESAEAFFVPEVLGRVLLCNYCVLEFGYKMENIGRKLVEWGEGRANEVGWLRGLDGCWRLERGSEKKS